MSVYCGQMAYSYIPMLLHTPLPPIEHQSNEISRIYLVTRILVLAGPFWNLGHLYITMLSAKKARQRTLIVSGGDRILEYRRCCRWPLDPLFVLS
jgi:hypothetical protein